MNLGTFAPILTQIATPILGEALGNGRNVGFTSATNSAALDARATLAQTELNSPEFWQPPPFDWQKAALVATIGFLAGHLVGRGLK